MQKNKHILNCDYYEAMAGPLVHALTHTNAGITMLVLSLALFLSGVMLPRLSYAQVPQGTIVGNITDPSGAAIPGASVTLQNQRTGIAQKTVASASGGYTFLYLDPGLYQVTVEKSGFKTLVHSGIIVEVAKQTRVDLQLQVGQAVQTVQVTGRASRLDTDSATVGGLITSREVSQMPLNGRDFTQLETLLPGTVAVGTTGGALITQFATAVQVGGTSYSKTAYDIDGVDDTFNVWNGPAMNPSIDSIQEFRIQESQFGAQYGRGGAEIDVVTKSGTNQFHGELWEFLRNGALDAGNYVTHKQDTLKRNQYGANLGGPIVKDKAFFFANWEGQREVTSVQTLGSVFTDKMRTGDLSEFPTPIINPQTGQPFTNNVIPESQLDPIALSYMDAMMPHANLPGIVDNFILNTGTQDDWDQYIARVDYQPTEKDRFFLRGDEQHRTGIAAPLSATSLQDTENFKFINVGAGWTHTWTPTVFTQTRFGFHRESLLLESELPSTLPTDVFTGFGPIQPPPTRLPFISISPYYNYAQWGFPLGFTQNAFELIQNASFIVRNHTVQIGYDGRTQLFNKNRSPEYMGTGNFAGVYSDNGVGDYLLGLPFTFGESLGFVPRHQRYGDYAFFVQDDWKTTRDLTLNLGLRYEIATEPSESNDLWGSFYVNTQKIVVAGNSVQTSVATPSLLQAYHSLIIPASQTDLPPHTLVFGDHNNFAPRFGFAWRPFHNNNTVVRGGFGIFYLLDDGNIAFNQTGTLPYGGSVSVVNTRPTPSFDFANPFSAGIAAPPPPSEGYIYPHIRSPYLQQTSLGIERQLSRGVVGSIDFQDQNSKKLESSWNLNQPPPGGTGPLQSRRPFPQYVSIGGTFHDGHARYDAVDVDIKKHSTHYTFEWSHTWAKNLERISPVDPFNRDEFYGPGDYVANMDKLNFVMDLPFGKGMRWANEGGTVNAAIGDWTFAGIFIPYQSGDSLTPTWSGDPANVGVGSARPNRVGSGQVSNPTMARYFDAGAFVAPTPGTFGNTGTGILTGPSRQYYDLGIYKAFPIKERLRLQFRIEMFDAFNHPNWSDPLMTANAPGFGTIPTKILNPRVIQFALKLSF